MCLISSTWRQHNVNSSEHVPHEQQKIFFSPFFHSIAFLVPQRTQHFLYLVTRFEIECRALCANWIILKFFFMCLPGRELWVRDKKENRSICIPMSNVFAINEHLWPDASLLSLWTFWPSLCTIWYQDVVRRDSSFSLY